VAETKQQLKPEIQAEIKKYKKALQENPGSRMFAALADAYRKAGDIEAAIETAEQGVKKHPKYLSGLVVLGQAYQEKQEFEKAVDLFRQVTRMNPENVPAQRALAQIYDRQGKHEEATRAYRVVTILDPTDSQAKQRLDILEATSPEQTKKDEPDKTDSTQEKTAEDKTLKQEPAPQQGPEERAKAEEYRERAAAGADRDVREGSAEESKRREAAEAAPSAGMPLVEKAGDAAFLLEEKAWPEKGGPGAGEQKEEASDKEKIPPPPLTGPAFEGTGQKEPVAAEDGETGEEQQGRREPARVLSEEEMLDHFFGGGDLEELGIAAKAGGYVVASASEAIPGGEGEENILEIKASNMASIFWKQGFREKALSVMAHEMIAEPQNKMLAQEFKAAARAEGKDPEELLRKAHDEMSKSREHSAESADSGAKSGDVPAADPDADTDPGYAPEEQTEQKETAAEDKPRSDVQRQGMGALKSYVNNMKHDKES